MNRPRILVCILFLGGVACQRRSDFVQVASAGNLTCARSRDGHVLCWGDDGEESLVAPTRTKPSLVSGLEGAVDVDVAASLGCAATTSGELRCFRDHLVETRGRDVRLVASDVGLHDVAAVSLGPAPLLPQVCIVRRDRTTACLRTGREGLPTEEDRRPRLDGAERIAIGDMLGCIARDGGKLTCWGGSAANMKTEAEAFAAPPLVGGVKDFSVGSAFGCAVDSAGQVSCFGLEKGAPPRRPAKLVRAGVYHACIVDTSDHVSCWGDNRFGQLGQQSRQGVVEGVEGVVDLAVGVWHTCALERTGRIMCWGRNSRGQLGDGTRDDRPNAKPVEM